MKIQPYDNACYVGSNMNGDIVRDCINRSHVDALDDREMDEFLDDPQAQEKFKFKWQKTSNPRNPLKLAGNLVFDDHVLSGVQRLRSLEFQAETFSPCQETIVDSSTVHHDWKVFGSLI